MLQMHQEVDLLSDNIIGLKILEIETVSLSLS